MMRDLFQWPHDLMSPSNADLIEAGIALALASAAIAIGWLVGRRFGDQAAAFLAARTGSPDSGLAPRMRAVLQRGTIALLHELIFQSHDWHAHAALVIGVIEATVVAMLAVAVLRGLRLPRWAAWTMALLAFGATIARARGGIDKLRGDLAASSIPVGAHGFSLLWAINLVVTVVLLFAASRLAGRVIAHLISRSPGFDPTQKLLGQKLAGIAVIVVAFFIGIDLLGIDLTAFAVFSGALGLAVGFGLQKTIGNLIAGIILLMDRSIKPGDVIVVGDSFGWVNKIGMRAVSVITRDGKEHLIPNEDLMTREVENWSYSDRNVRVRIPVGVSYSCDLKLAQELMLRAAKESPRVLDNPKPNVWLAEFGDSSVNHEILAWINDPEGGVGNVRSDVLNRLWYLFKEHGIEIPFPQRDVHIRDWPGPPPPRPEP